MTRKASVVRIALSTAVAALALVLIPGALADPGGGNGGGGTSATMTFSPTPVSVGQQYTVNLSGLNPDVWIALGAYYMGTDAYWCSHYADSAGNWSCTYTAWTAGSILHTAYQRTNSKRWRTVASTYLTVS